jgi:hypothetical protein
MLDRAGGPPDARVCPDRRTKPRWLRRSAVALRHLERRPGLRKLPSSQVLGRLPSSRIRAWRAGSHTLPCREGPDRV